jgi:hypothetical protein
MLKSNLFQSGFDSPSLTFSSSPSVSASSSPPHDDDDDHDRVFNFAPNPMWADLEMENVEEGAEQERRFSQPTQFLTVPFSTMDQPRHADSDAQMDVRAPVINHVDVTNELLRHGFFYLKDFAYLVCTKCECFVSSNIRRHSLRMHRLSVPPAVLKLADDHLTVAKFKFPETIIKPFPFVRVTSAFACKKCDVCFSNARNVKDHLRSFHELTESVDDEVESCYCQVAKGGNGAKLYKYFRCNSRLLHSKFLSFYPERIFVATGGSHYLNRRKLRSAIYVSIR